MLKYLFSATTLMLCAPAAVADDGGASATLQAALATDAPEGAAVYSVAPGVTEYVPAGYDPALTPSLILVREFEKRTPVAAGPVAPAFANDGGLNTATIALCGDESLYGTGEVQGPLLRNGQTIELWNTDNYSYKLPDRMYQSHPWVMAVRPDGTAWGVIFDTPARARLTTGPGSIVFSTAGSPFRVYTLEAASPQELLRMLGRYTGTMEMPPRWAIGYHQCRFSYYPDSRVRELADTFRTKQIPCDVIWMDIDYMDGYRVFTFDPGHFPEPSALNDYLHGRGFKAVYMIDPGIKVDPDYWLYVDGRDRDMYVRDAFRREYHGSVWPGPCAFPDFTRADVRRWWAGLYKPFMACGIDGIWNDMNEPAVMDGPLGTMPLTNVHLAGGDLPTLHHLTYHNAYGRLMVEASRDGILAANPDKRPFVLSRANLLGGQRFAATWTGDNAGCDEHMRMSIPMSITLGLSGQPFNGPDIGGFADTTTADLFGEWMGFGAFFPFCRGHACRGTNQKEPWAFGQRVERASRLALQRRYRLMPYYYTLFRRASAEGLPVMAPVFFADPADPALRAEEQAFLIGDDLLVIPSFAESPALPKGDWRQLSLVKGDTKAPWQADLRVRPGSIIPVGAPVQCLEEDCLAQLTLVVNPDADGCASGSLYWDAGDGWDFRDGAYALLSFQAETDARGRVTVSLSASEGSYPVDLSDVRVEVLTDRGSRRGTFVAKP